MHSPFTLAARPAPCALQGMYHLHEHRPPIIHRDLKSPNLLVSLSQLQGSSGDPACQTLAWQNPQHAIAWEGVKAGLLLGGVLQHRK